MTHSRRFGMTLLVTLLIGVYTLSHSGKFHIVDEVSLFAVTESIALRGEVDTNTIAWTQWVNSPGEVLGAFGPSGEVYSKKGPGPAFLAVPWYYLLFAVSRLGIEIGLLQGTLLFNVFVTAFTALLLWWCATQLGYSDWTGATLGLAFGLCTIAWPYANQFFGEPTSAAALLGSFASFAAWRRSGQLRFSLLGGVGGAVALATVNAHVILVGVLFLYGFWPAAWRRTAVDVQPTERAIRTRQNRFIGLGTAISPLILVALLLLVYNQARFGAPLETGYHFAAGEGFSTPIWQGLWGLLFSPYRGFFWHSPLMIAGVLVSPVFAKKHRMEAAAIVLLFLVLTVIYSTWWMWWGGFAWGPRFLVPVTPFIVLFLAPPIESIRVRRLEKDGTRTVIRPGTWALLALTLVALIVQVAAVTVNFVNYEIQLRSIFPTDWSDPLAFGPPATRLTDFRYSPVVGQVRLLVDDFVANTDLAWLWADGNIQWLPALIGAGVVLTTGLFLLQWWWRELQSQKVDQESQPVALLSIVLVIILCGVWLGEVARNPHYGQPGVGYRAAIGNICELATKDDALVTVAPFAYQVPMNWLATTCPSGIPVFGYAANSIEHAEAQLVLSQLVEERQRIWFVTGGLPANDPDNTVEQWLAEKAHKANDLWYEDYRLLQYGTSKPLHELPLRSLQVPLVGTQTSQVTIEGVRFPSDIQRGNVLPIEIHFQLAAPTEFALRWFVQLLAADGTPVALLDTDPSDGYRTFATLPAGETLVERAGLQLPLNILAGEYTLIAGLYNPEDQAAARLRTPDGSDFVKLGTVLVD